MSETPGILIIEDEFIISENIKVALEEVGYRVLGQAFDYDEAVEMLGALQPDLVMLDIHLGSEKSGIDLAKFIRVHYHLPFIFLTSFSDKTTLEKAKPTMPNGYLVKPFDKDELFAAIEVALFNFARQDEIEQADRENEAREELRIRDALFVKKKNLFVKVLIADILYVKSDHIYLEIQTNSETFTIRSSFNDLESLLGPEFLRVHRSYLVNLLKVDAVDHSNAYVKGNAIPVGRTYREQLMERIQTLL